MVILSNTSVGDFHGVSRSTRNPIQPVSLKDRRFWALPEYRMTADGRNPAPVGNEDGHY